MEEVFQTQTTYIYIGLSKEKGNTKKVLQLGRLIQNRGTGGCLATACASTCKVYA